MSHKQVLFHDCSKINPSDCVDMACDGLLKVSIEDVDGSILNSPGFLISQSEYDWNVQHSSRGLGDYRIPKEMVTELDGTRIPYSTLYYRQGMYIQPH